MSKKARSARGDIVDFDLLTIKQQLADAPIPVGATHRRKFIDEKDGFKNRTVQTIEQVVLPSAATLPSALSFGAEAAAISANTQVANKKASAK
jgi:hypothetical protein